MRFSNGYKKINSTTPTFNFRYSKYFFSPDDNLFAPIEFDTDKTFDVIHDKYSKNVQEGEEIAHILTLYGRGNIVIKEKNIFLALLVDIFNPFYIFQVFSFIVWFLTEYEIYAYCIIFLTVVSIVMELVFFEDELSSIKTIIKIWMQCYSC